MMTFVCAVRGCDRTTINSHHVWYGHGQRVACVFQSTRKSGTPGGVVHAAPCRCNLLDLCWECHMAGHRSGDMWLLEQTGDERVRQKLTIRGKL